MGSRIRKSRNRKGCAESLPFSYNYVYQLEFQRNYKKFVETL